MGTLAENKTEKVSYDEFLRSFDEDVRAEWVDGEVQLMSPVSSRHQKIAGFLYVLITSYLDLHPDGELLQEVMVKLGPDLPARVPDLAYLRAAHTARDRDTHIEGPVDLAVEIVSIDSRTRDRGDKYYEYEQAGVEEYWLVDPLRGQAEFYLLAEGKYRTATLSEDGIFESTVLEGLRIKVEWLWREPLPRVPSISKEAGL